MLLASFCFVWAAVGDSGIGMCNMVLCNMVLSLAPRHVAILRCISIYLKMDKP